jgi:hypothetical protein
VPLRVVNVTWTDLWAHATDEELLDAVFSVQSLSYQIINT